MDAVRFIEERKRLCKSQGYCTNCPLKGTPRGGYMNTTDADAGRMVAAVEEWSAAHPRKTRQSVFLEQWPDTQLDREGSVIICPRQLCKGEELTKLIAECRGTNCYKCRREFWRKVVR